MSGYRTYKTGSKPVPNGFRTGLEPVSAPGCPVEFNWNRTSDSRRLGLERTGRPITGRLGTGHKCKAPKTGRPVFGRLLYKDS